MSRLLLHNVPLGHPALAGVDWSDGRDAHRKIMGLFGHIDGPGQHARRRAGVLFRVEEQNAAADGTRGRILIQANRDLAIADTGVRSTDLAAHLAHFLAGDHVRVLLRANPVRTINRTRMVDGNQVVKQHRARIPEHAIPFWFAAKLASAVTLDTTMLSDEFGTETEVPAVKSIPSEVRLRQARHREVQLVRADLFATAVVADADALRRLCLEGVGRAKAYGCGMLTVIGG